jgi:hypothetical protein
VLLHCLADELNLHDAQRVAREVRGNARESDAVAVAVDR